MGKDCRRSPDRRFHWQGVPTASNALKETSTSIDPSEGGGIKHKQFSCVLVIVREEYKTQRFRSTMRKFDLAKNGNSLQMCIDT